ncbi:MAG TPA: xanthine dehydrogenase family protein molybdopterin-binding subunit [bacterium]|nr:xanthine dehydrogenase family protein molybdopterin-binding subunit [bacterium]
MSGKYVGTIIRRREDPRLVTGRGQYVDDISVDKCLHATIFRSAHAHARLTAVRLERARAHPSVVACFGFADLSSVLRPLPAAGQPTPPLESRVNFLVQVAVQMPLAARLVRYVGEPIALIAAADRSAAEDALALIEVDYEPLPAVMDVEHGLDSDGPFIHEEWGNNVAVRFALTIGDPDRVCSGAPIRLQERFKVPRSAGMPIEPRGVLAVPDPRDGGMTVWASTQVPHLLQRSLIENLGLAAHRVRVVAPDVGGGFGTKCSVYPEDVLIPIIAARLHQPVKWIESRREHLQSATHSREQLHEAEVAAAADGTVLAFRDRFLLDQGAYNPWGIVQPYNTIAHMLGPYRIRHAAFEARSIVTNKAPHAPYRGAGRPEAVFVMERMLDLLARRLEIDPADLRRRNTIRPEEMPYDVGLLYRDGNPLIYDTGDFSGTLERALAEVEYDAFRQAQPAQRARGVYRGIGIAAYVEGTGIGPYESATVRVDSSGGVVVATGACSQGQGHETTFAQIVADSLGVDPGDVTVIGGDTREVSAGVGTFASRSLVLAGNGIARAAQEVRQKLVRAAAALLEASEADLEVADGRVFVRGIPSRGLRLAQLVQSSLPTFQGPRVADPIFAASTYQTVPTVTFASAAHVVLLEVDPETGLVRILRYVVAHDCGHVVNPKIVDGQIHGGVAQGIGGGLWEAIVYDGGGQLLTGSLMDYAVPKARDLPLIETIHLDHPSPRNPLGVKGVGEGGAIAPPAALANAIEDALAPFGIRITEGPVTAERIVALISTSQPPTSGSRQASRFK